MDGEVHGSSGGMNLVRPSDYCYPMIITALLQSLEGGAVESTTVECQDYTQGFEQLKRTLPERMRLLSVRPER